MKGHNLKTWPEPFQAIWGGSKRFEYREQRDREFAVGDELYLHEWDPQMGKYTQRTIAVAVEYIAEGPHWGIPEGFCVMSLAPFLKKYDTGKRV